MKIGNFELKIVESGSFMLDGGAMFGIIPKPLWQKTNPSDEGNRIALATRNLLLVSDTRKILIDTGMGNKWNEKSRKIYEIEQETNNLEKGLEVLGYQPDDITDVLLTHLHFDHTGGSTKLSEGKIIPAFANARYYVQEDNFRWALEPTDRDRGSYIKANFEPLAEHGVLLTIEENAERIENEIEIIRVHGHTYSQQLFKISDGNKTVLYCGDLFPYSSHIPLPYIMGYDLQPLITLAEKKELLPEAVEEEWILFFEHDPFHAAATVKATEKGFAVKEFIDVF
ncbi:MAG: MBL fold metallo-hydrolase [Ignavibacteriales bacterium]|nr:MBL fold metallo-hydrolase [Ignavibacteriales bacterium]